MCRRTSSRNRYLRRASSRSGEMIRLTTVPSSDEAPGDEGRGAPQGAEPPEALEAGRRSPAPETRAQACRHQRVDLTSDRQRAGEPSCRHICARPSHVVFGGVVTMGIPLDGGHISDAGCPVAYWLVGCQWRMAPQAQRHGPSPTTTVLASGWAWEFLLRVASS